MLSVLDKKESQQYLSVIPILSWIMTLTKIFQSREAKIYRLTDTKSTTK